MEEVAVEGGERACEPSGKWMGSRASSDGMLCGLACVCVCVEREVVIAFIIGAIFCPKALYLLFKRDLEFVERYIKRSQKKKAGKQTYAKGALLYSAEKTGESERKGPTQAWQ